MRGNARARPATALEDVRVVRQTLIALGVIGIGLSGALLALGAMVGLSESHAGTPAMVRHGELQLVLAASGSLWSIAAALRCRSKQSNATSVASLLVAGVGQLCLWELLRRYDVVRVWTLVPTVLALTALISAVAGWLLLVFPLVVERR